MIAQFTICNLQQQSTIYNLQSILLKVLRLDGPQADVLKAVLCNKTVERRLNRLMLETVFFACNGVTPQGSLLSIQMGRKR